MSSAATAFTPITIGPITLRNRFIRAGANEGMSPTGHPTLALLDHHRRMARGGVGMTTLAYGAISRAGLTFSHQYVVNRDTVPALRKITDAVHTEGAAACLQITHAGAFTQLRGAPGSTPPSSSGGFNIAGILSGILRKHAMDQAEMDTIAAEFVTAAMLAREAGFDAVEIHMGHGYLLNQFTSPLDNHRKDDFGGTPANRARYPAQVLARVKHAVGKTMAVTAKINSTDGVVKGATGDDAAILAKMLQDAGADLLTLSGGRNIESPWALFSGPMPIADLMKTAHGIIDRLGFLALKLQQPRNLAFRELYFLEEARKVRAAVTMPLSLVGGIKSRGSVARVMEEGFDCLSLARVLFHDANFVRKLQSGEIEESGCTSCNRCVAKIYAQAGTECVLSATPNDVALNQQLA